MLNQTLQFGEWTPDLPHMSSPLTEAKNVIPHGDSYLPLPSLSTTSNALSAYCRGAIAFQDKEGNVEMYAGDEENLYRLEGLGTSALWVDKSSATYTTGLNNWWRFVKWGEKVIAVNFSDAPQIKTFGTATDFADLGGSPPKAQALAVVRSFVVLGNIDDGTHYPNKVQWSGQNLETSWGSSAATQADSQVLAGDGGTVQAIMSGDTGLILQERSIWEMQYQGPPTIFAFRETAPGLGTPAPQSAVRYGNVTYFLAQDGFYQYVIGQGPRPIGDKKIDKWFMDRSEETNIHRMVGALDLPNGKVVWCYPTGFGNPDELIMYDYKTGRWSYAAATVETIFTGRAEGYTLESLDTPSGNNIDSLTISLDSSTWKGGALGWFGFDASHESGSFTGAALTSRLETIELARDDASMIYVNSVRPLVQGSGSTNTVYIGTRNNQNDSVTYGSAISANSIGEHNTRSAARYMRFRCDTAGGFERAVGIRINVQPNGIR
jgi:hypothetical protein